MTRKALEGRGQKIIRSKRRELLAHDVARDDHFRQIRVRQKSLNIVKRDSALKAASIINDIEKIVRHEGETLADLIKGGVEMDGGRVRFHDVADSHPLQFRVELPAAFSAEFLTVDAGNWEASRGVIAENAREHQR